MVIVSSGVFASRFNSAVIARKRSFRTPATSFALSILNLLATNGYVHSFTLSSEGRGYYCVSLNHKTINFTIKTISTGSRKLNFNFFKLKSASNAGFCYIIKTPAGLQFSDVLVINKISGQAVYQLKFRS
jgi:ribosomal protein S8